MGPEAGRRPVCPTADTQILEDDVEFSTSVVKRVVACYVSFKGILHGMFPSSPYALKSRFWAPASGKMFGFRQPRVPNPEKPET